VLDWARGAEMCETRCASATHQNIEKKQVRISGLLILCSKRGEKTPLMLGMGVGNGRRRMERDSRTIGGQPQVKLGTPVFIKT
jgi:hypothetical protein